MKDDLGCSELERSNAKSHDDQIMVLKRDALSRKAEEPPQGERSLKKARTKSTTPTTVHFSNETKQFMNDF